MKTIYWSLLTYVALLAMASASNAALIFKGDSGASLLDYSNYYDAGTSNINISSYLHDGTQKGFYVNTEPTPLDSMPGYDYKYPWIGIGEFTGVEEDCSPLEIVLPSTNKMDMGGKYEGQRLQTVFSFGDGKNMTISLGSKDTSDANVTYNMASFLLRTGKGKLTFYFLCQPILKEMAEAVLKTKGKYGVDRTKTSSQLEKEAIDSILDKYDPDRSLRRKYEYIIKDPGRAADEYRDLFTTFIDEDGKESSRLRENLFRKESEPSSYKNSIAEEQVRMYYAWKALKPYADALANLVKYSKIDTKKTGKSFAE